MMSITHTQFESIITKINRVVIVAFRGQFKFKFKKNTHSSLYAADIDNDDDQSTIF